MGQLTGKFRYLIIVIGSAASPPSRTHVGSAGLALSQLLQVYSQVKHGTSAQVSKSEPVLS